MTRARDIADLVDANGDIVAGALDNVPAADLVNDTTPQLGGNLDAQSNNITSVGALGVNQASPSYQLDVTRTSGGTDIARFKGSTSNALIRVQDSDNSADFSFGGDDGSAAGSGSFVIYDRNNTAYRLLINSSGHVTMPNQPAFSARHNSLSGVNVSANSELGSGFWFGTYEQDNGNNFNGSTGRFTAPVAGWYFFSYHARTDAFSGSYLYHSIMKNGSSLVARNLSSFTYTYNTKACSGVTYLAQNDYVSVYTSSVGDTSIHFDADGFFSGFLIG